MAYTIKIYETKNKKSPFNDWLNDLETAIQIKILARLKRATLGNFGNHEPVGEGVYELKFDTGPGYRIYYTITRGSIIFLLAAGTKRTQDKDIAKAKEYLDDFKTRKAQNGGKNKRF